MAIQSPASTRWVDVWYPGIMAQLTAVAGDGYDDDTTGTRMPNLSSIDLVAVLGLMTPALASSISRLNIQNNGESAKGSDAVQSAFISSDGRFTLSGQSSMILSGIGSMGAVDAKTYLTYCPVPFQSIGMDSEEPWKRFPIDKGPIDSLGSYEPYSSGAFGDDANLNFLRQAISDWQSMVSSASSAILTNAADTTGAAPQSDMVAFTAAMRALCADMDVLNENPPEMGSIVEALRYALGKTSEFVGKAAAEISNEVGKQAGIVGAGLTGGFLENAGILSIVVVGILVHLFLS